MSEHIILSGGGQAERTPLPETSWGTDMSETSLSYIQTCL